MHAQTQLDPLSLLSTDGWPLVPCELRSHAAIERCGTKIMMSTTEGVAEWIQETRRLRGCAPDVGRGLSQLFADLHPSTRAASRLRLRSSPVPRWPRMGDGADNGPLGVLVWLEDHPGGQAWIPVKVYVRWIDVHLSMWGELFTVEHLRKLVSACDPSDTEASIQAAKPHMGVAFQAAEVAGSARGTQCHATADLETAWESASVDLLRHLEWTMRGGPATPCGHCAVFLCPQCGCCGCAWDGCTPDNTWCGCHASGAVPRHALAQ